MIRVQIYDVDTVDQEVDAKVREFDSREEFVEYLDAEYSLDGVDEDGKTLRGQLDENHWNDEHQLGDPMKIVGDVFFVTFEMISFSTLSLSP
jgi:hypothetical protein